MNEDNEKTKDYTTVLRVAFPSDGEGEPLLEYFEGSRERACMVMADALGHMPGLAQFHMGALIHWWARMTPEASAGLLKQLKAQVKEFHKRYEDAVKAAKAMAEAASAQMAKGCEKPGN